MCFNFLYVLFAFPNSIYIYFGAIYIFLILYLFYPMCDIATYRAGASWPAKKCRTVAIVSSIVFVLGILYSKICPKNRETLDELRGVLTLIRPGFWESWVLNGTDTETSIEFLDTTILIPIPGIVTQKIRDLNRTIPRREVLQGSIPSNTE